LPRAHRYYLPGYIWHLTHRCHNKSFLLQQECDRQRWVHWLRVARKKHGLSVLDYTVTCNHVHLLVYGTDDRYSIAGSMQLVAGRIAQEYNERLGRRGAFWEDRYHATAVESRTHLLKCITYIDLNMVRARAVAHPREWKYGGYHEIQNPGCSNRVIDLDRLLDLTRCADAESWRRTHANMIDAALKEAAGQRDDIWSQSVAVGSRAFVEEFASKLGMRLRRRSIEDAADNPELTSLREPRAAYEADEAMEGMAGCVEEFEGWVLTGDNKVAWSDVDEVRSEARS